MDSSEHSESPAELHSVHPAYQHADSDLKLVSSEGVAFFVHSVILRLASPVFADMLSMPRGSESEEKGRSSNTEDKPTVKLTENEDVVAALLDSIYPRRPKPKFAKFDFVQRLADAADKYDFTDVIQAIRDIICNPQTASDFGSPLCNFSLACRQGWSVEAKALSFMALSANIDNPSTLEVMDTIEPRWMLEFLNFRRRRYVMFRDALVIHYDSNQPEERRRSKLRWEHIAVAHAATCRSQAHNKTYWNALKMYLLSAFDSDPTGQGLGDRSSFFWGNDRLNPIVDETCTKCSNIFFTRFGLSQEVQRILDEVLPKQIE